MNYSPRLFPAPRHLPAFVCSQIIRNSSPASKRAFHHSPCPARCHLAGKSHTKALEFPSLFSSGCALFHFPYPASLLFATLTETTGVCTNSSHSGTRHYRWTPVPPLPCLPLFPIHYPLSPLFSYSAHYFALFCTQAKLNSFLFKRFRTLCQKTPGGGVPFHDPGLKIGPPPRSRKGRNSRFLLPTVTSHESPACPDFVGVTCC